MAKQDVDALYRQIGARIAELRQLRSLTQERLAAAAELNPSYLARIEAGARRATVETLSRIATELDAPLADLFGQPSDDLLPPSIGRVFQSLTTSDLKLLVRLAGRLPSKPLQRKPSPRTPRKSRTRS